MRKFLEGIETKFLEGIETSFLKGVDTNFLEGIETNFLEGIEKKCQLLNLLLPLSRSTCNLIVLDQVKSQTLILEKRSIITFLVDACPVLCRPKLS